MSYKTAKTAKTKTSTSVVAFRAKHARKYNTAEGEQTAWTDVGVVLTTSNPDVLMLRLNLPGFQDYPILLCVPKDKE